MDGTKMTTFTTQDRQDAQRAPLTDEQIVEMYESSYLESGLDEWEFDPVYFARAIERAHGIE